MLTSAVFVTICAASWLFLLNPTCGSTTACLHVILLLGVYCLWHATASVTPYDLTHSHHLYLWLTQFTHLVSVVYTCVLTDEYLISIS